MFAECSLDGLLTSRTPPICVKRVYAEQKVSCARRTDCRNDSGYFRGQMAQDEGATCADNFIGGNYVPPLTGEYLDVVSPSDGKVLGR